MHYQSYNSLRSVVQIAHFESLSEAAKKLNLTKGALSHQIKRLEQDLGFEVFERHSKGIRLSKKGQELLSTAEPLFRQLEVKIAQLNNTSEKALTIGVTTYFASRWLSPRLMQFMQAHPHIRLRIQPMLDLENFAGEDVDIAIRWGNGNWKDCEIRKLFSCPAWPTGDKQAYDLVRTEGIQTAFEKFTLLRDRKNSNAWSEWYSKAGLKITSRFDTLIIPDPNVRVQAVLDGQGVALNDALISDEIHKGRLFRLSDVELSDYGYFLAYDVETMEKSEVSSFIDWITSVT